MKNVLVTGAAGFIGRNLVKELLKEGYGVIGIDNFSSSREENIEEFFKMRNFTFVEKDIRDDMMLSVFKTYDPEIVFHLAANAELQYSIKKPIETHDVNVNGTLKLLEAARQSGVKRFILASSSSVYGDVSVDEIPEYEEKRPISPYASQKLISEIYCKLYCDIFGLETISLRLFNVYGPYQNPEGMYATLIPKTIRWCLDYESPRINGDGFQTRDFIYVDEVVKAFIKAGTTKNKECFGESINIGKGISTTVNEVVSEIMIQTDRRDLNITKMPKLKEPRCIKADIDKAKSMLDWKPSITLSSGIIRTIEYFKEK